ncbi:MAG: DUF3025 domain-containing protein [Gammaproteobacteria bacterium]|nr:DUF3025 domain-containing protein [Gammaproteobacteria bacterium]
MNNDNWNPDFITKSPLFETIRTVVEAYIPCSSWPTLAQHEAEFKQRGLAFTPVPQADKPGQLADHYEPRIYLKKEIQTRTENWHDFFNAMIWLSFPATKSRLNERHYHAAIKREYGTNRSPLENAITLFDECGIIVISNNTKLLDMIRQHEWTKLFCENRQAFENELQCLVFGHAMYEKALTPYIGMTCQALLIEHETLPNNNQAIDKLVADLWQQEKIKTTKDLHPFPVLGVPGWYDGDQDEGFYDNKEYFRPLKNK